MKTTLDIPDTLFEETRRYAASHGIPFREAVAMGLRQLLDTAPPAHPYKLNLRAFRSKEAVDLSDWAAVRTLIYESRGG